MKLAHLEALRPVCPLCRRAAVRVSRVLRGTDREVDEGLLECASETCRFQYPIIDGIPLLVADLRRVVGEQILPILSRTDLSEPLVAILGECCGASSPLDQHRQHLSTYVSGHWGDRDGERSPLPVVALLERGLAALAKRGPVPGPVLDLGCSVGRTAQHLASRTDGLVLGIDLNVAMLRVARRALSEGRVSYARRRVGLVYDERAFAVPNEGHERVDFWCCDVLALPFVEPTFGLALSLNVIDCIASPIDHLRSLRDLVRPGGGALLASPFDWSPTATAPAAWIGGHSPHGEARGRSETLLRQLLGGDHPLALKELAVLEELDGNEWWVRLHERSTMRYLVDLFVLGRS